jgi:hypothetical protein
MLGLRPSTAGELAVALQLVEALLERRGEVRLVRVGTATVAIAGTEIAENEVGGDGPALVEAIVAATCDLVRYEEMRSRTPAIDLELDPEDELDPQGSFAW